MKNTSKVLGIAVIIAAIALSALSMTGCTEPEPDPVVESITVTPPTTTTYIVGDTLDTTGMVVTANYDDGSTMTVTDYTTDFDSTTGGTKTVTVTYGGFSDTFTVIIIAPYIITYNNTLSPYTVTKDGTSLGNNTTLQNAIDAIRTNAAGANCVIKFDDGTNANGLVVGDDYLSFRNISSGTWGAVTLTGKITANRASSYDGTIYINSGISVTSKAWIENANTDISARAVYNNGTLNIIGGTIIGSYGIYNYSGTVNISGGTISISEANYTYGSAVYNSSSGTINITGGTITSTITSTTTNTSVYNSSSGTINISGGTITAESGYAVRNTGTGGIINITGGTITASTGYAVYTLTNSTTNITGGTITGRRYPSS